MILPQSRSLGSTSHRRGTALRKGNIISITGSWAQLCWAQVSVITMIVIVSTSPVVPVAQGDTMTKVRPAVAFSTGVPLSKTRKLMLMGVPTGWLVLMAQLARPTRLNSCPACTGDAIGMVQEIFTVQGSGNLHF